MKRISYVGGSFVTSDEVADALLAFIASGTRGRRNQVVVVPEADSDGRLSPVSLLLGPASQLLCKDEPTAYPEPDTAEAARLVRQQASVHEDTAALSTLHPDATFDDEL